MRNRKQTLPIEERKLPWLMMATRARLDMENAERLMQQAKKCTLEVIAAYAKERERGPKKPTGKSGVEYWKKQFELGNRSPVFKHAKQVSRDFKPAFRILAKAKLVEEVKLFGKTFDVTPAWKTQTK